MAFIVQDATGEVVGATAYISVDELKAHHSDRANDLGSFDSSAMKAAIIKATDYLDFKYSTRFVGAKKTLAQTTEWPRNNAVNTNAFDVSGTIPVALKKACAEYAFVELSTTNGIVPAITQDDTGLKVKSKSEKVEGIEEKIEYADGESLEAFKIHPVADSFIQTLLVRGRGKVIR